MIFVVHSPDIVARNTIRTYHFLVYLVYVRDASTDLIKENGFIFKQTSRRPCIAQTAQTI